MHPAVIAQKTPDKPALIMAATGESLSFRQLNERSNQGAPTSAYGHLPPPNVRTV